MNKAEQPQNVGYARSDACLGIPETVTQREGDDDVSKRRRRLGKTCHELPRDLVSYHGPRGLSYQAYIEKAVTSGHDVGGVKEHYNRASWSQPNRRDTATNHQCFKLTDTAGYRDRKR